MFSPSSHNTVHRVSSSTSTSSSPSVCLHLHQAPSFTKTMEEVWRDINLASLNHPHPSSHSNFRSVIFQDFLARSPFDPPPPSSDNTTSSLYGPPTSPPTPLVTALSLGSTGPPNFHFDPLTPRPTHSDSPAQNQAQAQAHHHHLNHHPPSNVSSFSPDPFDSLACASGFPSFGNKRHLAESDHLNSSGSNTNSSGNVRHKRMIKNRESAARSRARKQAYTNELEQKVDYLSRENERLRKQQEQWCKDSSTHKKKNPLYRTSTAPF